MKSVLRVLISNKRRFRIVGIVFFVVALFAISATVEWAVLLHHEKNWESVAEEISGRHLREAEQAFVGVQRTARRIATELAQRDVIIENLSDTPTDRFALFPHLARISRLNDVGIEVFDRNAVVIAWEGRSGPHHPHEVRLALEGQLTSYVTPGPIYSQLFVATPVRRNGLVIGAILVRTSIEVNYPLNNKFVGRQGLAQRLGDELGIQILYDFSRNAEPRIDGRYASAILYGIDGTKVGVVSVQRPARSAFLEDLKTQFDKIQAVLLAVLIALVAFIAARQTGQIPSLLLRSVAFTCIIWATRYSLLWIDVPSSIVATGIFDPAYFASKFGGGLAKSIGEMLLTSIALALNTAVVAHGILKKLLETSPWWRPSSKSLRVLTALVCAAGVFFLLRGYAAIIRSAVFDSTLEFNDPKVIVPSFELGMMVLNLFLISFSLIVVVVGITSFVVTLISGRRTETVSWAVTTVVFLGASTLFGMLHPHPLTTTAYRLFFAMGAIVFTLRLHRQVRSRRNILTFSNVFLSLGLSAAFFYPLLDSEVHEKDLSRVRMFASEVLRPVDSWLKFIVDDALKSFTADETLDLLVRGSEADIDKLAFTVWAQSTVSREGHSCLVAFIDSGGTVRSQFSIGGQGVLPSAGSIARNLPLTRVVRVNESGSGINALKTYFGSMPVAVGDRYLGHAVVVAAAQQSLFRGETPAILRSAGQENLEYFYRPITISEYRKGILFTSNNSSFPTNHRMPDDVLERFKDQSVSSVWAFENIDPDTYETYFVPRSSDSDDVIGLSLRDPGIRWYLFNVVKVLVYYGIVVLMMLTGFLVWEWVRGRRYVFTFRDKLLGAMLITALVPIAISAYYGRMFATERLMQTVTQRLQQETATVGSNIQQRLESATGSGNPVTPQIAEQLSSDLSTDFNLYIGNELQVSSRPELYEAGILDSRLSGRAYANVFIRGKRFYVQTERIGLYPYAVGYRPLLGSDGSIVGIVSVPTLFRQDELEEEITQRNAFLFGAFALITLITLVLATTLANRIASPIHRLTEATRRVSQGDLDVTVRMQRSDGEIGELVDSFERMTKDLKHGRENLVRFERELAWKEMAKQVAHEIKNPLTPMKLSLQHLRQTYRDKVQNFDQVFEDVSRTMIEQIESLSRIASEFSHFARMPKARLEECDVNAILSESVHLFEQDGKVQFDLTLDPELPPVHADREELRRAFINIIRNGIQAMDNKGRMVIDTRTMGQKITITIKDHGAGISEEVRGKLFEPNFSTKTDGMGLGLAIVKKTLDDLKGTISVESVKGEGTTVTIVLPASAVRSGTVA